MSVTLRKAELDEAMAQVVRAAQAVVNLSVPGPGGKAGSDDLAPHREMTELRAALRVCHARTVAWMEAQAKVEDESRGFR